MSEYCGELISSAEADRRGAEDERGDEYLFSTGVISLSERGELPSEQQAIEAEAVDAAAAAAAHGGDDGGDGGGSSAAAVPADGAAAASSAGGPVADGAAAAAAGLAVAAAPTPLATAAAADTPAAAAAVDTGATSSAVGMEVDEANSMEDAMEDAPDRDENRRETAGAAVVDDEAAAAAVVAAPPVEDDGVALVIDGRTKVRHNFPRPGRVMRTSHDTRHYLHVTSHITSVVSGVCLCARPVWVGIRADRACAPPPTGQRHPIHQPLLRAELGRAGSRLRRHCSDPPLNRRRLQLHLPS